MQQFVEHRCGGAEDRCPSDFNTFTNTFPDDTRRKFVMTTTRCCVLDTSKSGDELISVKETYGPCEGRAEQHCYISVRTSFTTCGW